MKTPTRLVLPLLLLTLSACAPHRAQVPPPAPAAAPQAEAPIPLTVVGTSDVHGWIVPHEQTMDDGTRLRWGGSATFAGQLAILRAENPGGVVLVDAGDMFQGTLEANTTEGAAVIAVYNALGYDAAAVGNHEFDYGPLGPKSAATDPSLDPRGALRARAAEARFPLLDFNLYRTDDGARPDFVDPDGVTVVQRHGLRIGIAGLANPATPTVTNPVNLRGLRFEPLADQARKAAEALRARGADVRILAVHEGGACANTATPTSLDACEPSDLFRFLQALPPGTFDAVVAGHTHSLVGHFVNGMPVVESFAQGTAFGVIRLWIDPRKRRPLPDRTKIEAAHPICSAVFEDGGCAPRDWHPGAAAQPAALDGKPVVPEASIAALIAPWEQQAQALRERTLGVGVPAALTRGPAGDGPLGTAIAEAVRSMERSDVTVLNSGGIRNDIPAGPLTYGEVYAALPFDNAIATLTVTRGELIDFLEALGANSHGAPVTAGLKLEGWRCPGRFKVTRLARADGKPLSGKSLVHMTTNDFLAMGGDGLGSVMAKLPRDRVDLGQTREQNMREALIAYLEKRGGALTAPVATAKIEELGTCPAEAEVPTRARH